MSNPKAVTLPERQLKLLLSSFSGKQQPRVIQGIYYNPGILTHEVCGKFFCNNVPDIAQKSNPRLLKFGLKLICNAPNKTTKVTNSHHWYLCHIGEVEVFSVGESANDEARTCAQ
tara:strand:+ start:2505 stop:2849 length:345 start_codon:yes stop_codon:yes gene_type:complete